MALRKLLSFSFTYWIVYTKISLNNDLHRRAVGVYIFVESY
jgi:hypothetical protein